MVLRPNGQKASNAVGTQDAAGLKGIRMDQQAMKIANAALSDSPHTHNHTIMPVRALLRYLCHSRPQPSAASNEIGTSAPEIAANRAGKLRSISR